VQASEVLPEEQPSAVADTVVVATRKTVAYFRKVGRESGTSNVTDRTAVGNKDGDVSNS
jgi:hypothetical protein